MKSVVILVNYFGRWPEWFPLYLKTCEKNSTIDWVIHTDCKIPTSPPENVRFVPTTLQELADRISDRLGISFKPVHPYRLCDVRPAYGIVFPEAIQGYDYFGWSDVDILYGDIRSVYTEDVLKYGLVSAAGDSVTGFFTLLQNVDWAKRAYRLIPRWRELMERESLPASWWDTVDEHQMTRLFRSGYRWGGKWLTPVRLLKDWIRGRRRCMRNALFVERFTTPFSVSPWTGGGTEHPTEWHWTNGRLTNTLDGDREFLLIHFMNYLAPKLMDPIFGTEAIWKGKSKLVDFDMELWRPEKERLVLNKEGFSLQPIQAVRNSETRVMD